MVAAVTLVGAALVATLLFRWLPVRTKFREQRMWQQIFGKEGRKQGRLRDAQRPARCWRSTRTSPSAIRTPVHLPRTPLPPLLCVPLQSLSSSPAFDTTTASFVSLVPVQFTSHTSVGNAWIPLHSKSDIGWQRASLSSCVA